MAYRMKVTGSLKTYLPYMYNVSGRVELQTGENLPDDVMLVQFILRELIPTWGLRGALPAVNGVMNEVTGYWIFVFQQWCGSKAGIILDGMVSQSQADGYHSGGMFTIAGLNKAYKDEFPDRWATLADNPAVPALLRSKLKMAA